MTGLFSHSVGNVILTIDELIFFRGFETTSQLGFDMINDSIHGRLMGYMFDIYLWDDGIQI